MSEEKATPGLNTPASGEPAPVVTEPAGSDADKRPIKPKSDKAAPVKKAPAKAKKPAEGAKTADKTKKTPIRSADKDQPEEPEQAAARLYWIDESDQDTYEWEALSDAAALTGETDRQQEAAEGPPYAETPPEGPAAEAAAPTPASDQTEARGNSESAEAATSDVSAEETEMGSSAEAEREPAGDAAAPQETKVASAAALTQEKKPKKNLLAAVLNRKAESSGKTPFSQTHPVLNMTIVLFVLAAVIALILGFVNSTTAPIIAQLKENAIVEAASQVLPGAARVEPIEGVWESPTQSVRLGYTADDVLVGYAVEVAPPGYGGPVTVLVGVSSDGEVLGCTVLDMKETPNLGTKAKDQAFLSQFVGKQSGLKMGTGEHEIHAISGATVTSKAVTDGVAAAIAAALQVAQGGGTAG